MSFPGAVLINFVAKTTEAVKDVNKLAGSVNDLGNKAKGADGKVGGLSSVLKGGLAAGASLAAGGVFVLTDFMLEAGKAALEDQQSSDKLANTLKTIPGVTEDAIAANEDWILSMTLATNVADTDLREAVSKLTLATGDLTEAQKLTALAVDVSAGSGKSLKTVTEGLAKAATGNTAALEKQFPWLDKNKDGTLTYKEAVEGLEGAFDGAAEAAADTDPWTRIKTIWGELKEALGEWILPLINRFSDWFKNPKNKDAIQDFIDKVGDAATILGTDLVEAIKDAMKWLKDEKNQKALKDWADGMLGIAEAIGKVIGKTQTLLTWLGKLPGNRILQALGLIPDFSKAGGGSVSGGGEFSYTPQQAAPIMVTEEQVYRAVARLIMRGEVRNGRRLLS